MITIRLSMNGESPIMSPVSGLRSGAPGIAVSSVITSDHAERRPQRVAQALRLGLRRRAPAASSRHVAGLGRVPGADPALDEARRDERQHERDEDRRGDPEEQVRGEVDLRVGVGERGGVVGDLGQHAVERRDQEVHAEARGDAGERRRDAGQRVSPDALERDRPERYQHEVSGVGRDARDHAEQHDDERQRAAARRRRRACGSAPRSGRRPRPRRRRSSPPG